MPERGGNCPVFGSIRQECLHCYRGHCLLNNRFIPPPGRSKSDLISSTIKTRMSAFIIMYFQAIVQLVEIPPPSALATAKLTLTSLGSVWSLCLGDRIRFGLVFGCSSEGYKLIGHVGCRKFASQAFGLVRANFAPNRGLQITWATFFSQNIFWRSEVVFEMRLTSLNNFGGIPVGTNCGNRAKKLAQALHIEILD